jgi:uncharacterized membrane protein
MVILVSRSEEMEMSKKQRPKSHFLAILGLTAVAILCITAIAMGFRYEILPFINAVVLSMVIYICCCLILLLTIFPDAGGRA